MDSIAAVGKHYCPLLSIKAINILMKLLKKKNTHNLHGVNELTFCSLLTECGSKNSFSNICSNIDFPILYAELEICFKKDNFEMLTKS